MQENPNDVIKRGFEECLFELFAFHTNGTPECSDLTTSRTELLEGSELAISSSAGLASEECRIAIGLIASESTAKKLSASEVACPRDWMGELANQLLGRLKNVLSEYGIEGQMSLPVTITGNKLDFCGSRKTQSIQLIRTNAGTAIASIQYLLTEEKPWYRDEVNVAAEEGSVCLF